MATTATISSIAVAMKNIATPNQNVFSKIANIFTPDTLEKKSEQITNLFQQFENCLNAKQKELNGQDLRSDFKSFKELFSNAGTINQCFNLLNTLYKQRIYQLCPLTQIYLIPRDTTSHFYIYCDKGISSLNLEAETDEIGSLENSNGEMPNINTTVNYLGSSNNHMLYEFEAPFCIPLTLTVENGHTTNLEFTSYLNDIIYSIKSTDLRLIPLAFAKSHQKVKFEDRLLNGTLEMHHYWFSVHPNENEVIKTEKAIKQHVLTSYHFTVVSEDYDNPITEECFLLSSWDNESLSYNFNSESKNTFYLNNLSRENIVAVPFTTTLFK
ncbi:MAG: hypothetical protein JHC93_06925 [Parachlamydiales bacterium]|nr:hypothetical protein [Parachlamydiales bacterium]